MVLDGRGFLNKDSNILSVITADKSFSTLCIPLLTVWRREVDGDDDDDKEEGDWKGVENGAIIRGCSTACVSVSKARPRVDRSFVEAIGAFRIRTKVSMIPVSQ